jgi:hypothetical protein
MLAFRLDALRGTGPKPGDIGDSPMENPFKGRSAPRRDARLRRGDVGLGVDVGERGRAVYDIDDELRAWGGGRMRGGDRMSVDGEGVGGADVVGNDTASSSASSVKIVGPSTTGTGPDSSSICCSATSWLIPPLTAQTPIRRTTTPPATKRTWVDERTANWS